MVLRNAPRLLLAAVLAACALIVLPSAAADGAKPKGKRHCSGTNAQPQAGNLDDVRDAVLCLHNRERAARDLPALRENSKLRHAADDHSADMVAQGYFSHDSRSGTGMTDRILDTGYARGRGWSLGENIAWGMGSRATAAEIHRSWMESPGHRANILRREFREIGIGIALGAPVENGRDGATYTADFGVRR
jgi:uncharacterized protein YkwD